MLAVHLLSTALTLPSLKADFRLLSARCDRGFTANAATISKLQSMAADLEAMATADANQTFAPTASDDLLGKWYLDFCDAGDVLSLALIPLPLGARLGPIYQSVAADTSSADAFVVQNGCEFIPPGAFSGIVDSAKTVYEVEARCRTLDDTRVSLAFVGGRIQPPLLPALGAVLPDALIEQVQGLFAERVYLETTYLDEDMRIGRGPGRELYVLSKRPGAGSADL